MLQATHAFTPSDNSFDIEDHFAARLLRMAELYYANCSICQAAAIYLDIVREHGDTPEADVARIRLLQMSRRYGDERRLCSV
ncbi:MAG: hypothetical protein U0793_24975 [Gemmataceae bacterium]